MPEGNVALDLGEKLSLGFDWDHCAAGSNGNEVVSLGFSSKTYLFLKNLAQQVLPVNYEGLWLQPPRSELARYRVTTCYSYRQEHQTTT